jgi:hypothetical protein
VHSFKFDFEFKVKVINFNSAINDLAKKLAGSDLQIRASLIDLHIPPILPRSRAIASRGS